MRDILLPATDTAVAVEFVVVTVATTALMLLLRRHAALRTLVAGAAVFTAALMALRAVH